MKATNKRQRRFKHLIGEYSLYNTAVTNYLEKYVKCLQDPVNPGILYATLNQCVTTTGRLSSTGRNYAMQMQNIHSDFKKCFKARNDGWLIGEADEAQLEFRTAVWYAQDSQGLRDIEEKFDIHSYSAEIIGCERNEAKRHTFKPLYGGTSGTQNEREYYKAFKERYSDITRVQDGWVDNALAHRVHTLPTGHKFYYPPHKLSIQENGYVVGNTNVRNYPIQYLATGEIVLIALVGLWRALKDEGMETFIVNTVHDSIIAEVHSEEVEKYDILCRYYLEEYPVKYMKELYDIDFNVPLEAETSYNTNWKDGDDPFWGRRNIDA